MKKILAFVIFQISCNTNTVVYNPNISDRGEVSIYKCSISDLGQQILVSDCKACHTQYGIEEFPNMPTYPSLSKINAKILRFKMDSLKKTHTNHIFIDTLSDAQIDCIIEYIGRHSEIKP